MGTWLARRWRLALVLFVALIFGGMAVYRAQAYVRKHLPGYLTARLSTALGRPIQIGRISFWPVGAVSVWNVRLLPGPEETEPPLVAKRLRVYISWWDLLVHQRLRVPTIYVDGAHLRTVVDLRDDADEQPDLAGQLGSLYRVGLRQVGLFNSGVDVVTILPSGERQPVQVSGLDFTADLKHETFRYRASADRWNAAGLSAQQLRVRGDGAPGRVTLAQSSTRVEGGELAARGTLVTSEGDLALRVEADELPIGRITEQLGLPSTWDVQGGLTGTMDLSVRTGVLQRAQGTLTVAPGSLARQRAVFPWTTATAQVNWTPEGATLRDIDVRGDGLRLRGSADVGGNATQPFVQRPFKAEGTVEASNSETVARLARLMAFNLPTGRWDVGRGSISFRANGIVGNVQQAHATGRFEARDFMIRPTPKGTPLVIPTVQGDLERNAQGLRLRNVRATAEGLSASANATILPGGAGETGRVTASAQVDLTSLVTLRRQLPDAPLWQYVGPMSPQSRGHLTLTAQGPLAAERISGDGRFEFTELEGVVPLGQGAGTWRFPVRNLKGRLRLRENRLAVQDTTMRSDLFQASGQALIREATTAGGAVTGSARLTSQRWAELPPLQGRIPAGLSGGTLVLDLRTPEGWDGRASLASQPLPVSVTLRDAVYLAKFQGKTRRVELQEAMASVRLQGNQLTIPSFRLVTPHVATSGSGSGRQETLPGGRGTQWRLIAEGRLDSGDAGELLRWGMGSDVLQGGRLSAAYTVNLPTAAPNQTTGTARVRLVGAVPRLRPGTLPFPPQEARIRALTGHFGFATGRITFNDVLWQAPSFRLGADGSLAQGILDGRIRLTTERWAAMAGDLVKSLPVAGGSLTVDANLRGPVENLSAIPFNGTLTLRGAQLDNRPTASVPVEGGTLDLVTTARGTLSRIVASDLNGRFALRDLRLRALRPGVQPVRVTHARGRFQRIGNRISLQNLVAEASGARFSGGGELRAVGTPAASHRLNLRAEGPSLATLLPVIAPIPGRATGGQFTASLMVEGTTATPINRSEGRAEVLGARWTPPGQTLAIPIRRLAAQFTRTGSTAQLNYVDLQIPGGEARLSGTAQGLGTSQGMRHNVRLVWRLEDASGWAARFLPIPGGFSGGVFTGNATLAGTAAHPVANASGWFEVRDAGYMPLEQFLGGPVRPIGVTLARGVFSRTGSKTAVSPLTINTTVGSASGRVVAADTGVAQVNMQAEIPRLQTLIDLWPGFQSRIRGGRANIEFALHGPFQRPKDITGTVRIVGRDGALTVEDVPELYAEHPIKKVSTDIVLGANGSVRLENVKLRGPKVNLDGKGYITGDGRVTGEGKAWFSEDFTMKHIKPGFLRPIAKLFGFRRLSSDYRVQGTLRNAKLDMSLTRTLLWKLAVRPRVPQHLRQIATGDAPLWAPSDVPLQPRTVVVSAK